VRSNRRANAQHDAKIESRRIGYEKTLEMGFSLVAVDCDMRRRVYDRARLSAVSRAGINVDAMQKRGPAHLLVR